jgi:hypothetical protein
VTARGLSCPWDGIADSRKPTGKAHRRALVRPSPALKAESSDRPPRGHRAWRPPPRVGRLPAGGRWKRTSAAHTADVTVTTAAVSWHGPVITRRGPICITIDRIFAVPTDGTRPTTGRYPRPGASIECPGKSVPTEPHPAHDPWREPAAEKQERTQDRARRYAAGRGNDRDDQRRIGGA